MAYATLMCRRFFSAFSVFLLLAGMAVADPAAPETGLITTEIYTNPQANPSLQGWGQRDYYGTE